MLYACGRYIGMFPYAPLKNNSYNFLSEQINKENYKFYSQLLKTERTEPREHQKAVLPHRVFPSELKNS